MGDLQPRTLLHRRYVIAQTIRYEYHATVYQARDTRKGNLCAIKELDLSTVASDKRPQEIQRFLAEAKILSRLNHPNLPAFTDFFTEDARHYLVMEYIDGSTLEELLDRNGRPFTERRILGWARQLCDVLEYLHSQQPPVIFRNIKPGNIMLTRFGRIKLIDFGIARLYRKGASQDTEMLGTPGFVPPEQYGSAQTDERSDVYSLAMTLYQLMTCSISEKGFGLTDVHSKFPHISPPVARSLEKATALLPEDRYETIMVFRRALLGIDTFRFVNGGEASTPEELAELCARYPHEAFKYLLEGEIEGWFLEIGSNDLARIAKRIHTTVSDPELGITRLIQAIMGPNAQIRSTDASHALAKNIDKQTSNSQVARTRKTETDVNVWPKTIDFGQVYPGLSALLLMTIDGSRGAPVSGTIHPVDSWIISDTTTFNGISTPVRIRLDSTNLSSSKHYTGTIVIKREGTAHEIVVKVAVDVLNLTSIRGGEGMKKSTPMLKDSKTIDHSGELFGKYRLDSHITRGSIGNLYLGQHIELNTSCVIKIIHNHINVAQFQAGLPRIAGLRHPNILRILDFSVKDNTPFLVMDYAHHGSLKQHLSKDIPLPLTAVIDLAKQIGAALQSAHNQKVAHGYLVPHHLLLGDFDEILLSGFDHTISQAKLEERPLSTRGYIAPEQMTGRLIPASDQYALAAMIYQWLTGEPAFNNGIQTIETPSLIHMKPLEMSQAVEKVIMKALAKEDWQRHESVAIFINALIQAHESERQAKTSQLVGQTFSNYRTTKFLGRGGYAYVYLGRHNSLDTPVAVKVLYINLKDKDVEAFRNEARILAKLKHPHVVRVLDYGIEGHTPFLVMDFAPNGTLRDRHPKGSSLPLHIILPYVKQVALALQYAHDQKIVHRDVKPENILLGPNDEILLSDFGIAVIAHNTQTLTPQKFGGTPSYTAPEQSSGRAVPASDQYSLGVVVYEWLTGNRPFTGTYPEIVHQHLTATPPSLREKNPKIPPAVEQVIMIALAKDPHQRFKNVHAFASALEQASQE